MTKLVGGYFFASGHVDEACCLVKTYHYSHRPPASVQFVGSLHQGGGLFGDLGEMVAACFFSIPPTRWAEPVWELSRLVRQEGLANKPPLTALIGTTVKAIKRLHPQTDLLVSFADWGEGHHGGIYQAASWNYDGKRGERMDGLIVDGHFIPGRSCNSAWGTSSPSRLAAIKPESVIVAHMDQGKHLYWRALSKSGEEKAVRLGLKREAYPKPQHKTGDDGTERVVDRDGMPVP